jgi:hypothetical protein
MNGRVAGKVRPIKFIQFSRSELEGVVMSSTSNCPHCQTAFEAPAGVSEVTCPTCHKLFKVSAAEKPDGSAAGGKVSPAPPEPRFLDPEELKETPFPVDQLVKDRRFQEGLQADPFADFGASFGYLDNDPLAELPEPPADTLPDQRQSAAEEAVPERHASDTSNSLTDATPTEQHRPRRTGAAAGPAAAARPAAAPGRRVPVGSLTFDPGQPAEYLRSLAQLGHLDESTRSCIGEALQTCRAGCHKAAAVLLGVATERIFLDLRHTFVTCFQHRKEVQVDPAGKARVVWRQMAQIIYTQLKASARTHPDWDRLARALDARVDAFSYLLRLARDEGYRPANFEFVTPGEVHAALSLFPALADLLYRLRYWMHRNLVAVASPAPATVRSQ